MFSQASPSFCRSHRASERLYPQTHSITAALATERSGMQQDAPSPPSPPAPPDPCCGHRHHHHRLSGTAGNGRVCAVKTHERALKEEVVWKWAWIQGSREATFSLDSDQWSLGRRTGLAQPCQEGTLTPIPELSPLLGEEHTPSDCSRNRVLGNRDREMAPTKDSWGQLSKVTKGTERRPRLQEGRSSQGFYTHGVLAPPRQREAAGRRNPGSCNRVGETASTGELWTMDAEARGTTQMLRATSLQRRGQFRGRAGNA